MSARKLTDQEEAERAELRHLVDKFDTWRNGRTSYRTEEVPAHLAHLDNAKRSRLEVLDFIADPPEKNQMKNTLAHFIASACAAERRCVEKNNAFADKWDALLDQIEKEFLPRGSGIDSGCKIIREKCDASRVTITFSFHHMDENGFYCGWSDYRLTLRPDWECGSNVVLTGQNRNQIKEYLADLFHQALVSDQYEHTAENTLRRLSAA